MNDYIIVVDSTTDLPAKMADELGVVVIPYIFTLDNKDYYNYLDSRELSSKDFYDALRAGKTATTTQVTAHRYMETWTPYLKEGKDILYMCLSSALSKSYEQSILATEQAKEAYPNCKVITIDSRSASIGQGALAYYASNFYKEGKSIDETAKLLKEIIPNLHHWIMVDDLHHLRRGGRVSGASAFVGSLINIKPIITIVDDGRLIPLHKVRGRAKVLEFFREKLSEFEYSPKDQPIFIAHSDSLEMANQLKEQLSSNLGIDNFVMCEMGPVIGAHTGPGTLAVVFVGGKRATSS